nr:ABC transporter permease subunit [Salidesulfovibrio brasiliensis]
MRSFATIALTALSRIAPVLVVCAVAVLLGFLLINGLPAFSTQLFFGDTPVLAALTGRVPVFDGIWPACVGTVALVVLSCSISIPLGILSGICMNEFTPAFLKRPMVFATDLLAGIPSIVMGLFGFALILFLRSTLFPGAKTGLWLSAVCMAVLVLPYCINTTRTALEALPEELRLMGPSLGLTHEQSVFHILLPAAARSIMGGVILAIGRAAEDTAVILITGVVANAGLPRSILDKYEALPFKVYYIAAQFQNELELQQGFGTALTLLCLTTCLFLGAHRLRKTVERRWN